MTTSTQPAVDLERSRDLSVPALVLAILSIPGSTLTWDVLPGGGFLWGFPPAIAAILLAARQLQRSRTGRGRAIAAIVIASAMILMMIAWSAVEQITSGG